MLFLLFSVARNLCRQIPDRYTVLMRAGIRGPPPAELPPPPALHEGGGVGVCLRPEPDPCAFAMAPCEPLCLLFQVLLTRSTPVQCDAACFGQDAAGPRVLLCKRGHCVGAVGRVM